MIDRIISAATEMERMMRFAPPYRVQIAVLTKYVDLIGTIPALIHGERVRRMAGIARRWNSNLITHSPADREACDRREQRLRAYENKAQPAVRMAQVLAILVLFLLGAFGSAMLAIAWR
ncbi:MAG: hypothetical protein FJ399_17880 [Verrucomicrobia bacterium]|nr:hypothetical protein [Verrucomicrobiota bacterium]